jgi:tetratricopeptide (TPR) repeat protein
MVSISDEVLMKNRSFILLLVLCCAVSFPSLCSGEDQTTALTVKKIAFTRDKSGNERIVLSCDQSCVPELSSIEEEHPRVVMDLKGVVFIRTKAHTVNTGGKLVKRIRSYLDKRTKILRVVLDMEPSNYCLVRPTQDPSGNTYTLTISENKGAKGSRLSPEKRIHISHPALSQAEERKPQEAAPGQDKSGAAAAAKDLPSVDRGRSELNAGEFAAAVDTFTEVLAAHPRYSLGYRLRGNAYDNLGDRQKAVEDWTQAARLGDTALQSYLDFLQVMWRDNPAR